MSERIRVFIVDDSAVVRQVLTEVLGADPALDVAGSAADPLLAFERFKRGWPDVIVSDVEMPRMDGVTFVRRVMAERPTPIVVCSSLTEKGAQTTMNVLAAGAVGVVTKPRLGIKQFLQESAHALTEAVKGAARASRACCRRTRNAPCGIRPTPCSRRQAAKPWPAPPSASLPSVRRPAARRRWSAC